MTEDLSVGRTEVYSLSRIVSRGAEQISQIEYRTLLKLSASIPMSFITDHLKSTDGYKNWMQPLTQASGNSSDSRARLVTSLGENSDLIELSLETSSMMFFR